MRSIKKLSQLSDVSWHLNKQTVVYPSNGTVLNNEREHPIVLNNLTKSYINLSEFFENINFKQVTVALLPWGGLHSPGGRTHAALKLSLIHISEPTRPKR